MGWIYSFPRKKPSWNQTFRKKKSSELSMRNRVKKRFNSFKRIGELSDYNHSKIYAEKWLIKQLCSF